jgi:hypothetical protein
MLSLAMADPQAARPGVILALQRQVGNRAVQRFLQPKLNVRPAGDRYEEEADRTADQVMALKGSSPAISAVEAGRVQRLGEKDESASIVGKQLSKLAHDSLMQGAGFLRDAYPPMLSLAPLLPLLASQPELIGVIAPLHSQALSMLVQAQGALQVAKSMRAGIPQAYKEALSPKTQALDRELDALLEVTCVQVTVWLSLMPVVMVPGGAGAATQIMNGLMPASITLTMKALETHVATVVDSATASSTSPQPKTPKPTAPTVLSMPPQDQPPKPTGPRPLPVPPQVQPPKLTSLRPLPVPPQVQPPKTATPTLVPPPKPTTPTQPAQMPKLVVPPPSPMLPQVQPPMPSPVSSSRAPDKPMKFYNLREKLKQYRGEEGRDWGPTDMQAAVKNNVARIASAYKAWQEATGRGDSPEVQERLKAEWQRQIDWLRREEVVIADDGTIDWSQFGGGRRTVEYTHDKTQQMGSQVHFGGGLLWHDTGNTIPLDTGPMVTHFSGPGYGIYVMGPEGDFHVGSHKVGRYHHSSLLAGGNTAGAGEVKAEAGRVKFLSNKSGHYRPTDTQMRQVLHLFEKRGIGLDFEIKLMGATEKSYRSADTFLKQPGQPTYKNEKDEVRLSYFLRRSSEGQLMLAYQAAGWKVSYGSRGLALPTLKDDTPVPKHDIVKQLQDYFKETPSADVTRGG